MTIGDVLKDYRKLNKMSQNKFVEKSGISKGYISMLENNTNARNGKPIQPTIEMCKKIALGMDIELDELLKIIDGNQKISLSNSEQKQEKPDLLLQKIVKCYNQMNNTGRAALAEQAEFIQIKHPLNKTNEGVM